MPVWFSRVRRPDKKWRQIAKDYPELKDILLEHEDANFHDHCKHSIREDKLCPYAQIDEGVTSCALIVEWWDDWNVELLDECMALIPKRKRINWRTKMLRQSGASFNEIRRV